MINMIKIDRFLTIVSVIVLTLTALAAPCQATISSNLYFLSSTTGGYYPNTYPTVLYKINTNHHLKRLRAITTQNQGSLFVRPYYDERLIIIGSLNNSYLQLDILDMEKPSIESSTDIKLCEGCNYTSGYFTNNDKELAFITTHLQQVNNMPKLTILGVNLRSKRNNSYDEDSLKHVKVFGGSSGNFKSDHLHYLYIHNQKPAYSGAKMVELGWELPDKLKNSNDMLITEFVNNEQIRVILTLDSLKAQVQEFFVYDKLNNQWISFKLNNKGWFKSFGAWLTTEQQTFEFTRLQALAEHSSQSHKETTLQYKHYLHRFSEWNIDKTGLLHIINPIQNIHIQLDTKAPDSEVLLIENGQVIYRVEDKIYSAKINGAKLTAPTLLVQSDEIPAIHWAFISDAGQ